MKFTGRQNTCINYVGHFHLYYTSFSEADLLLLFPKSTIDDIEKNMRT